MITDARALDVDAVPSEILRRNAELNAMSNALEPLLDGDRGDHSLVFGEPGTGKTACARYTLDNLERELVDVRTKYVNCFRHHSKFAILYSLVDGVGGAMDIKPHSTPHDKLYQRLRDADDKPYVVILDEVDQLDAKDEVLYELLSQRHIYLIAIANKPDQLMQRLDDRVASRLRGRTPIEFDLYPTGELVAILEKRAEHGLRPDAVADGVLEEIAESAAGNARIAIQTLREAALEAEREGSQITSAYVTHAEPRAREQLREKTISKLNRHQRIVHDIMREGPRERWSIGQIYDEYTARVEDTKSKKTIKRYLKKMEYYDVIGYEGKSKGRRYWAN
jgi:cell division control protein 6